MLTNAVIFHTTLDMMMVIRELIAEGWTITPGGSGGALAVPARIQRFGVYATDEVTLTPEPFDARLGVSTSPRRGNPSMY